MLSGITATSLLYGRMTIGKSIDLAVTDAGATHEFTEQGIYEIVNIGANNVYTRMRASAAAGFIATTSDKLMTPIATAPQLAIAHLEIGMQDVKVTEHPSDRFLRAICSAGQSTTLRITKLTKK